MVRRRNVIAAINAASAAMPYVRTGVGVLRKVGRYTQSLKRAANRVFRPTYRRLRYKKAVPRFRKRLRYRRRFVRRRRRVRGVPSIPRRNVYTRNRKGIRRGNTGILALQKRIQSGHTLPTQTFARMYFRGSGRVIIDNTNVQEGRIVVLNRIDRGPVRGSSVTNQTTTPSLYGHIMYKELWEMLYEDYLVLGATARIKINPIAYPSTLAARETNGVSDTGMPDGIQPGYWYARVNYVRNNGEEVGHRIPLGPTQDERLWAHERDFLADPTVIWVRDRSRVKSKIIRTNVNQGISGVDVDVSGAGIVADGEFRVSHETEMSTRPIYLRVNFSAKKHYDVKDILNEGPWFTMGSGPTGQTGEFKVRIGYIGFTGTGQTSYHVPLDRVREKELSVDVKYFVALRGPKINPNMYTDMEELAKIEARRKGIVEEEDDSEDEDDFLSDLEAEFDRPPEDAEGEMPLPDNAEGGMHVDETV